MPIIAPIPRTERRLMQKTIHKTKDKNHARRLTAMLMLHRGDTVSHVARTLCCARSSIGRWINWFTLSGVEGLKSLPSVHSPVESMGWLKCSGIRISYLDRTGQCAPGLTFTPTIIDLPLTGSEPVSIGVSRHGARYAPASMMQIDTVLEAVFELVRTIHFPHKPSRFNCAFACENLENLSLCASSMARTNINNIYSIEYEGTVHRGDMALLRLDGNIYEIQMRAMAYWMGNTMDLYPGYVPKWEILLPLPVTIGELVQQP